MKRPWHQLEHQVFRSAKSLGLTDRVVFVACSGGKDSMSLLCILQSLSFALKIDLKVLHFHHGKSNQQSIKTYRDKSLALVKTTCKENQIFFRSKVHAGPLLRSEKDFRQARYSFFKEHLQEKSILVTAHHQDDLLETRLIQLVRGGGLIAVKSMRQNNLSIWRPLLDISREQIDQYAHDRTIKYVQDPSNQDLRYFRNWIRNSWLPQLEKYRAGSIKGLSRSLETLAESFTEEKLNQFDKQVTYKDGALMVSLPFFWALSEASKKSFLIYVLRVTKGQNYTLSQAVEVRKQLDQSKKNFKFNCAGLNWQINAKQLIVSKSSRNVTI